MPPRLLLGLSLLLAPFAGLQAQDPAPREYRVLLVGNSLTYTNNLPALLRAVGASQGTPITTETYAAAGGKLDDRLDEGHVTAALRARKFDAVVLQEQGGHLAACMSSLMEQRKAPCAASVQAYRDFAELAKSQGAKVLLFGTWGPDDRWQGKLDRSVRMIAKKHDAAVFDAAGALNALHKAQPEIKLYPDGTHPSTLASVMLALALYRDVSGTAAVARDLRVTAPLLPVNAAISAASAMESQPGLAGDGKATVIPLALVEPLVKALPEQKDEEDEERGRRGR
ncbi:MAG: SGNH/GDSL hydrolase family protein [Thermomonas sp.]